MRPSQKQEPLDWRLIQAGSRSPAYQRCLLGHHCANNGRIEVHAPYLPTPYLCLTCLAQELGMTRAQLQAEIPNHLAHPYQLAQPDGSCSCQQGQQGHLTSPEESTTEEPTAEEDAMRTNHLGCHLANDDAPFADRLRLTHLARGLDNRRPNPADPERSQIYTSPPLTLRQVEDQCSNDPELQRRTEALRELLQNPNDPPPSFRNDKLRLPAIAPALSLEAGQTLTGVNLAQCHTGLYGYDLDEELPEDRAAFTNLLTQLPGAVLAGHSIRGRHYLFVLGPPAVTEREYRANWLRIMASYPAIVQRSSGQQSKNSNRLRTLVHDPNLWLSPDPEPTPWQPSAQPRPPAPASPKQSRPTAAQPPAKQPPTRRKQAEDLLDREALRHIAPPQEYNQWLSVISDLASLHFTPHEVDAWSARGGKYRPGEIGVRWQSLPIGGHHDAVLARQRLYRRAQAAGWANHKASQWLRQHDDGQQAVQLARTNLERAQTEYLRYRANHPNPAAAALLLRQQQLNNALEELNFQREMAATTSPPPATANRQDPVQELTQALANSDVIEVRYNLRLERLEYRCQGEHLILTQTPALPDGFRPLAPPVKIALREELIPSRCPGLRYGATQLEELLVLLAHHNQQDPFTTWLQQLPSWDSTDYAAASPQPKVAASLLALMANTIRRAKTPGQPLPQPAVILLPEGRPDVDLLSALLPKPWRSHWHTNRLSLDQTPEQVYHRMQGRILGEFADGAGLTATATTRQQGQEHLLDGWYYHVRQPFQATPQPFAKPWLTAISATPAVQQLLTNRQLLPPDITAANPVDLRSLSTPALDDLTTWLQDNLTKLWAQALHRATTDKETKP